MLGGFSMGAVMSYALGLGADRPVPGGILAFSGFIPTTEGWEPGLEQRRGLPVFIAHGSRDPVIEVEFARDAERGLTRGRPGGRLPRVRERPPHRPPPPAAGGHLAGRGARGGRHARKRIRCAGAAEDRERASMLQAGSGANGGPPARELEVIIIGAGFGGIGAAIELRRHGIRSVTILETAPATSAAPGTTTPTPASACDVPSHLYSYSYAQRADWSRLCSPQAGDPHLPARRRP